MSFGELLLLVVVAYLFVSSLWSVDPQTTLRRAIVYLFFALGVIGVANILEGDEYINLMRKLILVAATASLALLAFSPAYALMSDGLLRGVFTHKNVLGQVMAAGVLTCLHGFRVGQNKKSCVALAVMFIAVAAAAKSATSLMIISLFLAAEILAAMFRRGAAAAVLATIVALPFAVFLVLSPSTLLEVLGKDSTLTGRTELWEIVKSAIAQRPVFGWGFSAFWSPLNPVATGISDSLGWQVPEAHNGWLELFLEVGYCGAFLFAIYFLRSVVIAVDCVRNNEVNLGQTLLLCCAGILLVGYTEEVLIDPGQISVNMLIVLGLIGERSLRGAALAKRPQLDSAALEYASRPDRYGGGPGSCDRALRTFRTQAR